METNGKFDRNAKFSFIGDGMLILGCNVGSETHYLRAIDTRGRENNRMEIDADAIVYCAKGYGEKVYLA